MNMLISRQQSKSLVSESAPDFLQKGNNQQHQYATTCPAQLRKEHVVLVSEIVFKLHWMHGSEKDHQVQPNTISSQSLKQENQGRAEHRPKQTCSALALEGTLTKKSLILPEEAQTIQKFLVPANILFESTRWALKAENTRCKADQKISRVSI